MSGSLTAQQRLDDARRQLHLLATGQAARVFVDQNGERVEYTTTTVASLRGYVASLEQEVTSGKSPLATHPIGFLF